MTAPLIYGQRYYTLAALRILLSDTAAELTTLPHSAAAAPPVDLDVTSNRTAPGTRQASPLTGVRRSPRRRGCPGRPENTLPIERLQERAWSQPLIGGFIKIEQQRINGLWYDVTQEILAMGIAGRNLADQQPAHSRAVEHVRADTACLEINPNAVIRLQRVRDVPFNRPPAPPPSI